MIAWCFWEKSNFYFTALVRTAEEIEINWSAFTSVNKFFIMARPNGIFLLTASLDTVWSPKMAWA
jgi:hypothetical protein